jgi:hypothetical protein
MITASVSIQAVAIQYNARQPSAAALDRRWLANIVGQVAAPALAHAALPPRAPQERRPPICMARASSVSLERLRYRRFACVVRQKDRRVMAPAV